MGVNRRFYTLVGISCAVEIAGKKIRGFNSRIVDEYMLHDLIFTCGVKLFCLALVKLIVVLVLMYFIITSI